MDVVVCHILSFGTVTEYLVDKRERSVSDFRVSGVRSFVEAR